MKKLFILATCLIFGVSGCNRHSIKKDYDGTVLEYSDLNIKKGVKIVLKNIKTTNQDELRKNMPFIDKRLDELDITGHYIFTEDNKIVVIIPPTTNPDKIAKFITKKVSLVFKEPVIDELTMQQKIITNGDIKTPLWEDTSIDQSLISATFSSTQKSPNNWQVIFNLNSEGQKISNDISQKYNYQNLIMEFNDQLVSSTINSKTDRYNSFILDHKFSPEFTFEGEKLVLSPVSLELAEKIKNDNFKFKEPVKDPKTLIQKRSECCLLWEYSTLSKKMIKDIEINEITDKNYFVNKKQIFVIFNEQGKQLLSQFTKKHIHQEIALEVDGKIILNTRLHESIEDGQFSIYLPESFDNEKITLLAKHLESSRSQPDLEIEEIKTF